MADPLSITAAITGIAATALHSVRLLLDDAQSIKDAPEAIHGLKDRLHQIDLSLSSLQAIEAREWECLGNNIVEEVTSTIQSCTATCERFRGDLERWTSHSHDGEKFSWRDRAKVGFMKQGQMKSMQGHLQACQTAINSVVNTATLYSYSSIRHTRMTGDIKEKILEKQREVTLAAKATDTQLAKVAETINTLVIDDSHPEQDMASLEEEQRALHSSQKLLGEVLTKLQEVLRASQKQDHSIHVTFGSQNSGLQIGVSNGPISGVTFGGK